MKKLSIRMVEESYVRLKSYAGARGVSVNAVINDALGRLIEGGSQLLPAEPLKAVHQTILEEAMELQKSLLQWDRELWEHIKGINKRIHELAKAKINVEKSHTQDVRERLRSLTPEKISLAECSRNLRIISYALKHWEARVGALPESLQDLVPDYLSMISHCPVSGDPYKYVREKNSFSLHCPGQSHKESGLKENEPFLCFPSVVESDNSVSPGEEEGQDSQMEG